MQADAAAPRRGGWRGIDPPKTMPCRSRVARPPYGLDSTQPVAYRPDVSGEHQNSLAVSAVIADLDAGRTPDSRTLADAVRTLLRALTVIAPGRAVEVRVPPYGAVQCGEGPRHTRGTPPNVVETDPVTWVMLATGRLSWSEALATGRLSASGPRTDLSPHLPVTRK